MKFLKPGKVVIITSGRYAGKKGVIVQNTDGKSKERPYGNAVVAGIKKYPRKVIRGMTKRRTVNHKHFLPTRYNMDLSKELRGKVNMGDNHRRTQAKKLIKKLFQARYNSGSNRWFFQKLRF